MLFNARRYQTPFRIKLLILTALSICTEMAGQIVVSGKLYSDGKFVEIEILDGKIAEISNISVKPSGNEDLYISPGFIDNQVNGYAGVSFSFGGGVLTSEGVRRVTEELWKTGVTTFLPTLTTAGNELLRKNLSILSASPDDPELHGSIPGFHLEGPYISPVEGYRGAHPLSHVRKPDWAEFSELNRISGNRILQVTIAPEIEGAMDFISKCRKEGIVVGLGHHNADVSQITEAVDRGASISTHLGNGCANLINRHLNPLWPQLAEDRLMISIIGDGFHLNPEEIKVFYKIKGPGKTIITSDVTGYAALPPGIFINSEGDTLELTADGMVKLPARNVLAGSASPLKKGILNVMKVTGCSLAQAIDMVTSNPARLYKLNDRGSLVPGKRADIILFKILDNEIVIFKTIVDGKIVYERN